MTTQGYVSSISLGIFDSVFILVEKLEKLPISVPNEVQASATENGLSCGIISLSIIILEAALNRTRYVRNDRTKGGSSEYFKKICPDPELPKDVEEMFAVRDAIVHNHLWKADIYWDTNYNLKFKTKPKILNYDDKPYGNKRFRRVLNLKTRTTHRLNLNLFPNRIWRRDAYIILETCYKAFLLLENMDRRYFYFSHLPFEYKGNQITLEYLIRELEISEFV